MDNIISSKLLDLKTQDEIVEFLLDSFPYIHERSREISNEPSVNISKFDVKKTVMSKNGDIYNDFVKKPAKNELYCINACNVCNRMNIIYITNTGDDVCTDCGAAEKTSEHEADYKEDKEMDKTIIYPYKRENHFNEWINQFQAKEVTTVPQKIIEDLRIELKKQKITKQSDITHKKIKELLKKLSYNKYYEHIPYITTILHGSKPPVMSKELEDKLRNMFYAIQKPFDKFCPGDRVNFLSYSYVLYKFCELLGEDEYLQFFPLLKSREKLYKHDQTWKLITSELRWEYISTI